MIASQFGWTKDQIDQQPAVWLDWMLEIHQVVETVKAEAGQGL
jgi:hypothetical protein